MKKTKHTWLGGFRIAGVNLNPGRGWGMTGPPEGIPIVRPGIPCGTIGCWPVMGRADCIERTTGGWPRGGTPPRYWAETGYPAPCWLSWAVGRTYHIINIIYHFSILQLNWNQKVETYERLAKPNIHVPFGSNPKLYLRLSRPARSSTELCHLGWSVETLRLNGSGHEVAWTARLEHLTHLLHAHASHSLHVLRSKLCLAVFFSLSQGDIQRLGNEDTAIHLGHGLGCFFRRWKANEAKTYPTTLSNKDLLKYYT